FGTDAGLVDSANVTRGTDNAVVTLDYGMTVLEVQNRLEELYGAAGIHVDRDYDGEYTTTYKISAAGELAGLDLPELEWAENTDDTGLVVTSLDVSVDVGIDTIQDGTVNHTLNNVQTLTINGTSDFRLGLRLGNNPDDLSEITWTNSIAYDADADDVLAALANVLNPNGTINDQGRLFEDAAYDPSRPYTRNLTITQNDNVFTITFQGEYKDLLIDPLDIDVLVPANGTVALDTRINGINYYGLETLNIDLGSGDDTLQVKGSAAATITNLDTAAGDDTINIYNDDRSLDEVRGTLNIEAGAGTNTLNVDGSGDIVADPNVLITNAAITGLAPGVINYAGTDGNFAGGISIWSGTAGDTITVDSTHKADGVRTVTTLNTNQGVDDVTVSLDVSTDGFFVLNTQGGDDIVDASASSLPLVIFGGDGADDITGGTSEDIIFGDEGRVHYINEIGEIVTVLGTGAPSVGSTTDMTHLMNTKGVGLGGDVINGATWRVEIIESGAVKAAVSYTVIDETVESLTSIAAGLAVALEGHAGTAGYAVSADGNKLIISNMEDQAFDINLIPGSSGTAIDADPLVTSKGIALSGAAMNNETWTIEIKEGDIVTGTASYTVVDDSMETLAGIALELSTALNLDLAAKLVNGYTVTVEGDHLVVANTVGLPTFEISHNVRTEDRTDGVSREPAMIFTVNPAVGGGDTILAGEGEDFVLGGFGSDYVNMVIDPLTGDLVPAGTETGDDIIIGDSGSAQFTVDPTGTSSTLTNIETTDPAFGGDDFIFADGGSDVVLGGSGSDYVDAGTDQGSDIVVGDNGVVTFDASGQVTSAVTTTPDTG
ncbi:hypothetical protein HOD41_00200, partial [bacterium]|nr:hypothetical protein [bacterium]